ncbi:unnamed protein product (macronuclear) [Paramecium tetraurelia]|uniref:Dol-P-Glc:Glc(2)Man(9)GlcNAc(2)-PP-Dol alpha-1,2-glucosyltransferase n=1 Tax=Paramecium tetraurelia TaxID=5888 RepID=A0DAU3_PARTE|nr:uncharacterized protein GSPATT00015067001 [Paramecium tetraurelia]CAK80160.1 unnamed protein product [Paramecium tetraurelia]|eukprot:XP_001447557.1 hypothetical protein (macronuclear) [Paramecium tetraurelia strain d4-2]
MLSQSLTWQYANQLPLQDEEFHLDQMQHYLDSDFAYWNPKLTTPPMLYFLNYPFIVLLSKMGLSTLMACRIINTFIYPSITFLVLSKSFQNTEKALLFSILPTIYFYNFLFYTDTLSITLLSLSFQLLQSKYYFISSIFSLCSVMSRQTNILWIVYFCIKDYLDQNQAKLQFKDPRLSILFHVNALLNMILSDIKGIVRKYKYHIFILILFIGFLYTNGGVVLGDKDNHKFVFHAAQIMYFLPVLFIYFPINWNTLFQYTQLSIKRLLLSRNAKFTYLIILIICLEIVHNWTYIHPFILSDNRHYVFYIWRKILSKDVYRYCLCFFYALIIVILSRILISNQTFQLILLFIFTTLSLIFSPLIEPRYFSIPLLFFYYHCQFAEQTLKKQITVFTLMNCIIVYVFCEVKFSCDFPQCRFMF